MKIYIICPVRNQLEAWRDGLMEYTKALESHGHKVHLPFRDTPQDDKTGWNICDNHAHAMREADEVHIAYDGQSEGCLFDLGMAFVLQKPIIPITGYFPKMTKGKSYSNMVWDWNARVFYPAPQGRKERDEL